MSAILGGVPCTDPRGLLAECRGRNPPVPTHTWWGRANGFDLNPVGRAPGRGKLLLPYAGLLALGTSTDFALQFSGTTADNSYTLQKITVLGATAATPGWDGDPRATFVVDVADRRFHLDRVPIDAAYNVRSADGASLLTGTKNAGSTWTWQGVVNALATACGLNTAEFALPFSPDATPENLAYWGGSAWAALCDVLDRLACAPKYDPETDAFSVVRLGAADDAATAALALAAPERQWDDAPVDPARAWRPEKVRVRFERRPRPTDGSSPFYTVDVTLAAADGVVTGSYVQLDDDLAALAATGTPSNSAACSTRATERAGDWLRKRSGFGRPLLKVYRDFIPEILRTVPGATVGDVALDDRGGPMRTEVMSRPDRLLEEWGPLKELAHWFPPDAAGASLVSGRASLGSYSVTAGPGIAGTGLTLTLPSAGTYWVYFRCDTVINVSALGTFNQVAVAVTDTTASLYAVLASAGPTAQVTGRAVGGTLCQGDIYTASGANTLELYAGRGTGTFTQSDLSSIVIGWIKLA